MSDFQPSFENDGQATEKSGLQADVYGIKVRVTPANVEEPSPKSWREVASLVNQRLKTISVGVFDLVKEACFGSIRLLRGLSKMPDAMARRIEGAHRKSDELEDKKQAQLARGQLPGFSSGESVEAVEQQLLALQAKGIAVRIVQINDGWVIAPVRPEYEELAVELGTQALRQLGMDQDPIADGAQQPSGELLARSITTIELSVRSRKVLQRLGIKTIGELAATTEQELLSAKNFGRASLHELKARLAELGLSLRPA